MRALAGSTRVQVRYGALGGADLAESLAAAFGLAAGAGLADIEALLHWSGGARPRVLLIDESDAFVLGLTDGRYCYRVPLQQRLIRQDAPGIRLRQALAI